MCNGSNGTPDLRDRFVVGASSGYSVGAQGGANTVTLSVAQMPAHTHTRTYSNLAPSNGTDGSRTANTNSGTVNTGSTGGGQAHENRPPYYALCYIMKS